MSPMNVAAHDSATTLVARPRRDFVLSIYEIPSQLAISADSFMALGQFESGEAWQNVTIDGNVFAGKALVVTVIRCEAIFLPAPTAGVVIIEAAGAALPEVEHVTLVRETALFTIPVFATLAFRIITII